MDLLVVALHLVHVVLGALWVGMAVFTALFLTPAIQDGGDYTRSSGLLMPFPRVSAHAYSIIVVHTS